MNLFHKKIRSSKTNSIGKNKKPYPSVFNVPTNILVLVFKVEEQNLVLLIGCWFRTFIAILRTLSIKRSDSNSNVKLV